MWLSTISKLGTFTGVPLQVHDHSWLASKLGPSVSSQDPASIVFPYIQATFNPTRDVLFQDWQQCGSLSDTRRPQNTITSEMKALAFETFLSQCLPNEAARIAAVGLQTILTRCSTSLFCPVRAAQRVVSLPDLSLPAAADLPGVVDEHASLLKLDKRRRKQFFSTSSPGGFGGIFRRGM